MILERWVSAVLTATLSKVAPAELVNEISGERITAQVTDFSLYGCTLGVRHAPRAGATIRLEIVTADEYFESLATIVYCMCILWA
jgi:hypothetical protein